MVLSKRESLTKEAILSHVSEYDIVRSWWPAGRELKLDRGSIQSPFRDDPNPSFLIGIDMDGHIRYKDLGAGIYKGSNAFKFVQQMEGLQNFGDVLRKIDQRFNLGYSNGKVTHGKPSTIVWEQPESKPKIPTLLQVSTRKFTKEELRYWNSYSQDIDDLKRENIYAPKGIWRNRKQQPIELMTFCYYCEDIGKWKLYRPYAPKKTKDTPPHLWKWDNSIGSLHYVENLANMEGIIGICSKSRKDRMMIRKATGIDAICSFQNEDAAAVTDDALYQIWCNCRYRYIAADSDKKGKEFSNWMCREHGYNHINTPDYMLEEGINDFADMGRAYGVDGVRKYWQQKGVI